MSVVPEVETEVEVGITPIHLRLIWADPPDGIIRFPDVSVAAASAELVYDFAVLLTLPEYHGYDLVDSLFDETLERPRIRPRVLPEHQLRLVSARYNSPFELVAQIPQIVAHAPDAIFAIALAFERIFNLPVRRRKLIAEAERAEAEKRTAEAKTKRAESMARKADVDVKKAEADLRRAEAEADEAEAHARQAAIEADEAVARFEKALMERNANAVVERLTGVVGFTELQLASVELIEERPAA